MVHVEPGLQRRGLDPADRARQRGERREERGERGGQTLTWTCVFCGVTGLQRGRIRTGQAPGPGSHNTTHYIINIQMETGVAVVVVAGVWRRAGWWGGAVGESEGLGLVQRVEERRGPGRASQGAQMMRVIAANGACWLLSQMILSAPADWVLQLQLVLADVFVIRFLFGCKVCDLPTYQVVSVSVRRSAVHNPQRSQLNSSHMKKQGATSLYSVLIFHEGLPRFESHAPAVKAAES
ncbi:unnamed protein product [Pleuronectes platessa]|uniref:Uncharacterized protein n=1 Tax=Pleuronectes platessa TaxID=8262 RepID=A0A9N7VH43_PLEPL|nr:unnamed protein product [Pleuronectes platessa]